MKISIELKVENEELVQSGLSEQEIDATIDKQLTFAMSKSILNCVHVETIRPVTGERIFKTALHVLTEEQHDEIVKALEVVKNADGLSDSAKSFLSLALEKLKD